jgi:hypothetical protein
MCGVIDNNGQQWEYCNNCGKFVKIEKLFYELPNEQFSCGRDLCESCVISLGYGIKETKGKLTYFSIDESKIKPSEFLVNISK